MFLRIKGIGKILDSEIEMKGITFIAGENSTGKSTFGKALYCMLSAFYNTEERIKDERSKYIRSIINTSFIRLRIPTKLRTAVKDWSKNLVNETKNNKLFSEHDIRKMLLDLFPFIKEENKETIENVIEKIKNSMLLPDEEIQKNIINNHFEDEFEKQINHVNKQPFIGEISLMIDGKDIRVNIENNKCSKFEDNVGIYYEVIYIDTPFVIDDTSEYYSVANHRENLNQRLLKKQSDSNNTLIEKVIVDQKIKSILASIGSTFDGEFEEDEEGLKFKEKNLKKSISFSNVSTGVKTFLIIKRLLELGEIKEYSVLILDEPEIHLHPEWQLKFAEILVLLQREFNLTILLTTHSPYFLNAVEVYGKKYGIKDKINFYSVENEGDISRTQDVTSNVDVIYKKLAKPLQKLEDIEYED
jgi:predicted ATPase